MTSLPEHLINKIMLYNSHPIADMLNVYFNDTLKQFFRISRNMLYFEDYGFKMHEEEDVAISELIYKRILYRTLSNRFKVKIITDQVYYKDIKAIRGVNMDKKFHKYFGIPWVSDDED